MSGEALGFGIVGAGMVGRYHCLALAEVEGARLAGVCDLDLARANALAESFGCPVSVAQVEELAERDDVDVLVVGTPSGLHLEACLTAARHGKHIVVEKPIEVTLERADRIIEAAREAGVLLSVVSQKRFEPAARLLHDAVREGRFGRLVFTDARIAWWRSPEYYAGGGWKGTRALDGGGATINQAIHTIDLARWIFGPALRVTGRVATRVHEIEVEDAAAAVIEYASGALGTIQASTASWPGSPARLSVTGEYGSAAIEDGALIEWKLRGELPHEEDLLAELGAVSGSGAGDPHTMTHQGHALQFADVVRAVREGSPPLVDGTEGRNALELILAIYESSETGRPVTLGPSAPSGPDTGGST